ncbi:MAG: nitroreductase family protein [Acidimicrobiia bacterium]
MANSDMEFREALAQRHMVRNYTNEPVPAESLDHIIDAGVRAPSAGFSQGQRFVVVTSERQRKAIAVAAGEEQYVKRGFDPWISRAPVHIVICADRDAYLSRYSEPDKAGVGGPASTEEDWPVPYWWVDAGASMMAIMLAAVDQGLAAGFLGAQALDRFHVALDIPDNILVVGIATIGHAAKDRKSGSIDRGWNARSDVVFDNQWGQPRA